MVLVPGVRRAALRHMDLLIHCSTRYQIISGEGRLSWAFQLTPLPREVQTIAGAKFIPVAPTAPTSAAYTGAELGCRAFGCFSELKLLIFRPLLFRQSIQSPTPLLLQGPFVHISSIMAAYLGKIRTSVIGEYEVRPRPGQHPVDGGRGNSGHHAHSPGLLFSYQADALICISYAYFSSYLV